MKKRYILLFVAVLLILFSLIYQPIQNAFVTMSEPFLVALDKIGSTLIASPVNFFHTIKSMGNLVSDNEQLTAKITQLESEKSNLTESQKENEALKRQLGFVESNQGLNLIPAYVTGKTPNSFMHYLIITRGSKDNIKVGQAVISEGVLVGKIVEVNYSTSKVFLIINPNSAIPAITQDSRTPGLIKGEIGYGLVIDELSKDASITPGENVITSGLGGDFPKGLLAGKIEKIISSQADIYQKASVQPLLDFSKLEIVFVIGN